MVRETLKHKLLKKQATTFLKSKGFKEKEIFKEYRIEKKIGGYFLVDVVGIKFNKKIAIECGKCSGYSPHFWKLELLKELGFFDEIYYFPYINVFKSKEYLGRNRENKKSLRIFRKEENK